ncbi:MAG: DUF4364 family protein [Oscillospiraceae bacterium]|nr:DUF4364 family protein [Oscillospiraceae bacterium]
MKSNTFSAGVNPGGLRSIQEIKVLICYVLSNIGTKIKKSDLISTLQNGGISNYFETSEAFSDLESNNNLICVDSEKEMYTISESGKVISEQLSRSLPHIIKEKSIKVINTFISTLKSRNENTVKIEKNNRGYNVTCGISGDEDFNLMALTLYVPDLGQAAMVKENFHKNPGIIYRSVLAMLTQNEELLKESVTILLNQHNNA